jgi:hypothetical protein
VRAELKISVVNAAALRQYNCRNKCVPKCNLGTRGRAALYTFT